MKYLALIVEPKANDAEVFKYRMRAMWAYAQAILCAVASENFLWQYLSGG